MKAQFCYAIALAAVVAQGGSASVQAQGAPDIVWKTNGHNRQVTSIAIAPDGASLASGSIEDGLYGYLNVWRTLDTALVKSFAFYHEDVLTVDISPDGQYLAEGGGGGDADDGRIRIWQTSDWALMRFVGSGGFVTAFGFSSDSSFYAVASQDGNYIGLVPLKPGLIGGSTDDAPHDGAINAIRFAPHARTFASAGADGVIKVWNYTNGLSDDTILRTFSERVRQL